MKINKRADRVQFITDVMGYLGGMGAIIVGGEKYGTRFRLNKCTIHLRPQEDQANIYSIFCRFDKLNELTGDKNPKYNWHGFRTEEWKMHLTNIQQQKHKCREIQ